MISFNFKNISHVFIDFDGTLKDTDKIKGTLFVNIFEKNNKYLKDKINNHHLNNLGVTRLKKNTTLYEVEQNLHKPKK